MPSNYLLEVYEALESSYETIENADCEHCGGRAKPHFRLDRGYVIEDTEPDFKWSSNNMREYVGALKSKARDAVRDHLEKVAEEV